MIRTFICFIFCIYVFFLNSTHAQNMGFLDYMSHKCEVFSDIDSAYSSHFLIPLKIKSLTESRIEFDSLGNVRDSSPVYHYRFDSLGRMVEHRFDYSKNGTKYKSVLYAYSKEGKMSSALVDPFNKSNYYGILDGVYFSEVFAVYCEYRTVNFQLDSVYAKWNHDGDGFMMKFNYYRGDNFVLQGVRKNYLLRHVDYYENSKLIFRNYIQYER